MLVMGDIPNGGISLSNQVRPGSSSQCLDDIFLIILVMSSTEYGVKLLSIAMFLVHWLIFWKRLYKLSLIFFLLVMKNSEKHLANFSSLLQSGSGFSLVDEVRLDTNLYSCFTSLTIQNSLTCNRSLTISK